MLQIFVVTFPFFALIGAGYAAARWRLLRLDAIPGLNAFVLYFALPCMLYRFGSTTPIDQLLDVNVFVMWGVAALLLVALVVHASVRAGIGWNDAAFGALVAAFPNTGFMGVPLLLALLGAEAAGPIIITIVFDMLVTSSLCIALSRLDGADQHGAAKALRQALRGVVVNPLPWSIALGTLASAAQWRPPAPLWQTVSMLADAASPVALFTIGAVLARSGMVARLAAHLAVAGAAAPVALAASMPVQSRTATRPWRAVLPIVFVKLLVHPMLVWLLGRAIISAGVPLSASALVALVLVAALPIASNVSMLAERFGADNARIARIILGTTALAFFTFPVLTRWMR
ncbi:MAG: AEC family transporter [Variovorax sp.]